MRPLHIVCFVTFAMSACHQAGPDQAALEVPSVACPAGASLAPAGGDLRCVRSDGTADGPFATYWEGHALRSQGAFHNGLREGVLRTYWRNGAVQSEVMYEHGERVGEWRAFFPDGTPWITGSAKTDMLSIPALASELTSVEKLDGVLGEDALPSLRRLEAQAQQKGTVRIIAKLNQMFRPEGLLRKEEAFQQRNQFASTKRPLLERLPTLRAKVLREYTTVPLVAFELSREALIDLALDPDIASLQEDLVFHPDSGTRDGTTLTGAVTSWATGYTGAGTTIAVLDTGVEKTHPYFTGRVVSEACFSGGGGAYPGSVSLCPGGVGSSTDLGSGASCSVDQVTCDHGTAVAGVAAGVDVGSNSSGIAPDASIIAIQVFSSTPNVCPYCIISYYTDQLAALEHVYLLASSGQYNIAAVNMSLGGAGTGTYCDGSPEKPVIDNLRSIGVATVISAGNGGNVGIIGTPGCISSAVSVASTDPDDTISSFTSNADIVSLLAPGSWTLTAVSGGAYNAYNGTSISAPVVSGAFAILRQARPTASVTEMLTAMQSTGVPVADTRFGFNVVKPRIQIDAALAALPSERPVLSPNGGEFDETVTVTLSAPMPGSHIFYTTDGSTPSATHGTQLPNTGTVTLSQTSTLSAISVQPGLKASEVITAQFSKFAHLGVTLAPAEAITDGAAWRLVGTMTESFETNALNRFPWQTSGDGAWSTVQESAESHAARSPTLSDNQSATLQLDLDSDGGNLSFSYRVSSELNFDQLLFLVDGVEQGRWSGETGWQSFSKFLSAGTHSLKWVYEKDGTDAVGSDAAWIDALSLPGDAWRQSGTSVAPLSPGAHLIRFKSLPGWLPPNDRPVTIIDGTTQLTSATYVGNRGSVQVNLTPAQAVTDGAAWQLDDGAWNLSGATLTGVPVGTHTVRYKSLTDWTTPAPSQVVVAKDVTVVVNTAYAPVQATAPEISPAGGVYTSPVHVSISAASGLVIRYTTDGSTPSLSSPVYESPVVVGNESTVVIKALAFRDGAAPSEVVTATYSVTGQVARPTLTPEPGHSTAALQVQLATTTPNAVIHYTTDGSTPDAASPVYATPIHLETQTTTTIHAVALRNEWQPSEVVSGTFIITDTVALPVLTPPPESYALPQQITLATSTAGATLRYTTDGTAPTPTSTTYSAPISLAANTATTIRAQAYLDGWATSAVADGTYVIAATVDAPTVSPAPGTYTTAQSVVLSTTTQGASIRFTTDDSAPTPASTLYTAPLDVPLDSSLHLRARAFRNDLGPSTELVADYKVTGTVADISISPPPGTYDTAQDLTLTSATDGAIIRCTTDGSAPDASSPVCASPLSLPLGHRVTVRAQAFKDDWEASKSLSATYTLFPPLSLTSTTGDVHQTVDVAPGDTFSFQIVGGSSQVTVDESGSVATHGTLTAGTGGVFTYQAPSTGAFAGDHTIEVVDPMTGSTTHFVVRIPLVLSKTALSLLGGNAEPVSVTGAPAGTVLHFALLSEDESTPLDAATAGVDPAVTATADEAHGNPAVALVTAGAVSTAGTAHLKVSAAGFPDAFAIIQLNPSVTYHGVVIDLAGHPVAGATIALSSGTESTTTGISGEFSLRVAATLTTGEVVATGFETQPISSTQCGTQAGCTIRLAGTTASLSGTVIGLAANESGALAISYVNTEGMTVTLDPHPLLGGGSGTDAFTLELDPHVVWTLAVSGTGYVADAPGNTRSISLASGDVTGVELVLQPTQPTVVTGPSQAATGSVFTLNLSLTTEGRAGTLFFEHREGLGDWQQTPSQSYATTPAEQTATATVQLSCGRTHWYRAVAVNDRGLRAEGVALKIDGPPCAEAAPLPAPKAASGCASSSGSETAAPMLLAVLMALRLRLPRRRHRV